MTYGTQLKRQVRAELREWREVFLRESSYFAGMIYGDRRKEKRDGVPFITGFMVHRIDRGTYWLVKTAGAHAYILYKDQEYDPQGNQNKEATGVLRVGRDRPRRSNAS